MKTKLTLIGTMAVACAAIQLAAMPTEEETRRAEPVVQKLLASERAAFKAGKKTRSEVAAAAMKLADEADSDAAKLLLMKGAFVLYVQDGNLEKAVETMSALDAAISDMPPQSVKNIIETALPGASKKGERAQLYKLLGDAKKVGVESGAPKAGTPKRPEIAEGKKSYGGYTWSYRVKNGAATLVAEKDGEYSCAVSPTPTGNVSIPPTLNYIKVTSIGRDAFMNCTELTSVTIPEGVTSIERDAFYHCNGLKTVKIPTSMKQIEWGAFNGCSLTSVTIPDGVTHIGVLAFTSCRSLTTVVIPSSVRRIGPGAFLGCGELTSFTMRGERPDAPSDLFKYCGKLKSIHVPANAKSWEGMKEWQGIPLVFDAN